MALTIDIHIEPVRKEMIVIHANRFFRDELASSDTLENPCTVGIRTARPLLSGRSMPLTSWRAAPCPQDIRSSLAYSECRAPNITGSPSAPKPSRNALEIGRKKQRVKGKVGRADESERMEDSVSFVE
jgi:hypothetical protein